MSTKLQALQQARCRLSDPKNWTRGTLARNEDGVAVSYFSSTAVKWDLVGALCKDKAPLGAYTLLNAVIGVSMGVFNDNCTHAELLAKIDSAIDLAQRQDAALKIEIVRDTEPGDFV